MHVTIGELSWPFIASLMDSLKSKTLDDEVFLLANCWKNVKSSLIKKLDLHPEPEDDVPSTELLNRLKEPNDPEITGAETPEWAAGGTDKELQKC
ncbi:hypothetical protein HHI36_001997 [Cryptolaemus montrouzieri]|uniref:Uncharacterized protein n=1 Tax=Cryptolaemus montrouzieri TaxID=559131 RepID=A0ABD2P9L9_9CUCU